jgi:hypothetical protein
MATSPFDWLGYLELAQDLAAQDKEASQRSSLSRAYYYVYNIALARAEGNGFKSISGESTHGQLWRLYSSSPEAQCIRLGQIALRLKDKRERADYRPSYPRISEEVPEVLKDAQEFALLLDKLPSRFPSPKGVRQ